MAMLHTLSKLFTNIHVSHISFLIVCIFINSVILIIMQSQQINLKWKSFHSNMLSSFESMWEEEGLVDVTLATDGRCFKAHKIMLSASSPFFKKIFQMNPCQHPVVVLQDVHYTELESILKFVYKGEVNISQESLPSLLQAAETLQIRGLCRHFVHETTETKRANVENDEKVLNEKQQMPKSPCSSPKSAKKIKSQHSCRGTVSPPPVVVSQSPKLSVPVYPVALDEIKCEPKVNFSAISDDNCDSPTDNINLPYADIDDCDEDDLDFSSSTNKCAFDLNQASPNFQFPPFPCPFCERAYTRWGFRRRHIKACHTKYQSLPCKWCLQVLPSHADWESHVCSQHNLSRSDARSGLLILEEAEVVLQIPQPTRLDALVTMIKEQNTRPSGDNSDVLEIDTVQSNMSEVDENKNLES